MARASLPLIQALRKTARLLEKSTLYQWGHMGCCNCGFLAQTVTKRTKAEIHAEALKRYGDWAQQTAEYCPQSGLPIDHIISEMLALGFTTADLAHLEKLSDKTVLEALPPKRRFLRYNKKDDVVLYMLTWASLLEQELEQTEQVQPITENTEVLTVV